MGWLSCTKKSPVIEPLKKNNLQNRAPATATGTLTPRNKFGETSQVLRKIQKTSAPEIYLRSDQVHYSSSQYDLIESAAESVMAVGYCIRNINSNAKRTNPSLRVSEENMIIDFNVEKTRVESYPKNFSQVKGNDPLLEKNFLVIEKSKKVLADYNDLKKVSLNPSVGFFFDNANFVTLPGKLFNDFCQKITEDKYFNDLPSTVGFDKCGYLGSAGMAYSQKEIVKNQLPQVEAVFKKIRVSGNLPTDLLVIIEKLISSAKTGVRNMEHPERVAIFEKIAPIARPKNMDDGILLTFIKNDTLLNMPEEELDIIYHKLRSIPFYLVP